MRLPRPLMTFVLLLVAPLLSAGEPAESDRPNVLLVSVDTLRADRLSGMGYERPTSPSIDRLLSGGVNFVSARTIEPLTNPAMCSVLTSKMPHDHGATRNGLRLRPGLTSLPGQLRQSGYRTAAFVGNWTLRDKLSGLAEHFERYEEILNRRRWFGLVRSEATADDLARGMLDWITDHVERRGEQPFFAWVHFVEPHAPYRRHDEFVEPLGLAGRKGLSASDRYDTEVAYVDAVVGRVLNFLESRSLAERTLIVFVSDHGESLGEHGYWGHGRNLHEPNLRIPMALYWKGHLEPRRIDADSLNLDLAPTVLSLLGQRVPEEFDGFDWTGVLHGAPQPRERLTIYEAHKGAVLSKHKSDLARRSGLLAVGMIQQGRKEIFTIDKGRHVVFDLRTDPGETKSLDPDDRGAEARILGWTRVVYDGLARQEDLPATELDEESIAALKSLGYVD